MNSSYNYIFAYLKNEKISINKEEFIFQLQTHPDQNSILALSDTLNFFNVENFAYKIGDDEELPEKFIGHIKFEKEKPDFVFIQNKKDFFEITTDNVQKKLDYQSFKKIFKNVILVIDNEKDKVENIDAKKSKFNDILIALFIVLLICIIFKFSQSIYSVSFGILSLIGIFLSIEAMKTELGLESKISNAFCNSISNSDCAQVINSDKNKWLQKVKFANISMWFFLSQIITLFLFSVINSGSYYFDFLSIVLIVCIPMTLYSIYFQYFIEKKWCPICLAIIVIINSQLLFLYFRHFDNNLVFNKTYCLLIFFGYLFGAIIMYFFKIYLIEIKMLKEENVKLFRFSRNYDLFKSLLLNQEKIKIPSDLPLFLGNKESDFNISIITSPFCQYCREAHEIIEKIIQNHGSNIKVAMLFNPRFEFIDEKTKDLYRNLFSVYYQKGETQFREDLTKIFDSKNYDFYTNKEFMDLKWLDERIKSQTEFCYDNDLNLTPTIFINGYKLPKIYDRNYLEFFIADLLEDEDVLNEN